LGQQNCLDKQIELSTLLDSLPDAVLIVDAAGTVVEANRPAEWFTRRSREELRGQSVAEITKLARVRNGNHRPLDFPQTAVSRALRGERISNEHRTFFADEEDPIEALVSANPMVDEHGRILGALVVIRDVTEVTALQRRLADVERHQAIGQFAAGLIHDFNNVLDTIEKASTLLDMRANGTPEQRKQYSDLIHKAVRRGAEIIHRLRQYLKTGSHDLGPVDIRQLLEEALELTQPVWQAANNLTVKRDLRQVPPIHGNVSDLRRVFTNLIMNAIQAMPGGGELNVSCESVNSTVRAVVSDTGHGIPPEKQKKIFFAYFTTKQHGTGLGLSQAQRIVLGHKGNIRFHSEVGKGTKFVVDLPAMQERRQKPREKPIVRINEPEETRAA
jgi:PAS domain S-box-containing protein